MGLFYKTMIKEIKEDFLNQKEKSLESFLLEKENFYIKKYKIGKLLLFLNYKKLLEEENKKCEKIELIFEKLFTDEVF